MPVNTPVLWHCADRSQSLGGGKIQNYLENDSTWEDGPIPESDSVAICSPGPRGRMLLPVVSPRRHAGCQLQPWQPRGTGSSCPQPSPWMDGRFPSRLALAHGHKLPIATEEQMDRAGNPPAHTEPVSYLLWHRAARGQSSEHPELRDRRIRLSTAPQLRVRSCTSQPCHRHPHPTSLPRRAQSPAQEEHGLL